MFLFQSKQNKSKNVFLILIYSIRVAENNIIITELLHFSNINCHIITKEV